MSRSLLAWLVIGSTVTLLLWGLYQTPVAEDFSRLTFGWYRVNPDLFGDLELVPIRWLQHFVFTLAAFGVAWVVIDSPRNSSRSLFAILATVVVVGLSPAMALYAKLFEPLSGIITILLSLALSLLYASSEWGQRKHELRRIFGGRISCEMMRKLMGLKDAPVLHGQEQEVVILTVTIFFDEGSFAKPVERSQIVDLTNQFLGATSEFLCSRGAFLDEASPDCVRVFFGLPVALDDSCQQACTAALELRQRLNNLVLEADSQWTQRLRFGIALSLDTVISGIFGEGAQRQYSVLGQGVDLCRRLAVANLNYDSKILVDLSVFQRMTHTFEFRPIDQLQEFPSGKISEFYELMAASGDLSETALRARDQFWNGVMLLREGRNQEALSHFEAARSLVSEEASDPVVLRFIETTRHLLYADGEEPAVVSLPSSDGVQDTFS